MVFVREIMQPSSYEVYLGIPEFGFRGPGGAVTFGASSFLKEGEMGQVYQERSVLGQSSECQYGLESAQRGAQRSVPSTAYGSREPAGWREGPAAFRKALGLPRGPDTALFFFVI
jgi:hypothetical protein